MNIVELFQPLFFTRDVEIIEASLPDTIGGLIMNSADPPRRSATTVAARHPSEEGIYCRTHLQNSAPSISMTEAFWRWTQSCDLYYADMQPARFCAAHALLSPLRAKPTLQPVLKQQTLPQLRAGLERKFGLRGASSTRQPHSSQKQWTSPVAFLRQGQ